MYINHIILVGLYYYPYYCVIAYVPIVCHFQFYFLFLHKYCLVFTLVLFMNVLFSVVLLKINLLTLLTNHDTEKSTLNISVTL